MWMSILFTACVLAVYLWLKSHYTFWRNREVPHPDVNLFFGNIFDAFRMKKSLAQIYDDIYKEFKDYTYAGFYNMRTPQLIIRDPELVKSILISNFNSFHDNNVDIDEKLDPLFAKNPFSIKGAAWKPSRNQLTPCFSPGKIRAIFPIMQDVSKNFVKFIEDESIAAGGDGIEAKEMCAKFATENVINCAFGIEANCFKDPKSVYMEMGKKMLTPSFFQGIKLLAILLMPELSSFLHLKFVPDEVADYFRNLSKEIMKYRKENNIKRNDFMDILLEIKDKNFGLEDLAAHSFSLFVEGFETSSIAMSFTLYEIAANPDKQAKLREEIDKLIAKGDVTFETVQGLPYLDAVINESLRLYPPGAFLRKRCTEDFTLPPPKPGGKSVLVKTGMGIIIPISALQMDEAYFLDPEKFEPERFIGDRKDEIAKCTYMPFGEGPRICLGQRFGVTQIKIGIFNLVANYDIRVSKKTIQPIELDPKHFLTAAKGGLWLNYNKRS